MEKLRKREQVAILDKKIAHAERKIKEVESDIELLYDLGYSFPYESDVVSDVKDFWVDMIVMHRKTIRKLEE